MVKDYGLITTFDREDLPKVRAMVERFRNQDLDLAEAYLDCCNNAVKGGSPVLRFDNDKLEFLEVVKSKDLVVNAGLQAFIDIVRGATSNRFNVMKYQTSLAPPAASVSDTVLSGLGGTILNISAASGGWALQIGMKMFFGVIGGESQNLPNQGINEIGVFNSGGTMLNREVFVNNPLQRTVNTAAFILSCVVELCPTVA